ncbi:MAG TPA: DUF4293 domain-containing protein [Sediminibacterium sp.]|nr:DUF4293 domain-containing protein [Sediminibacterium sp.]
MIQRMQTIWLLVSSILAFTTLKLSFFSGNVQTDATKQFVHFTAMQSIPIMILTVGIAVGSLIVIFLYKNRKLQMRLCLLFLIVSALNLLLYYLKTSSFVAGEWSFDISSLVSAAIPVCLLFAVRGIYRDEQTVKSAERLR